MKKLFTLLLACTISLSLMGQQDIKEFKIERYTKKHRSGVTALVKKKSRNPDYASRHLSRQASSFRSSTLKAVTATSQTLDSIHWELYVASNSSWALSDREFFEYDGSGNMTNYEWFAYDTVEMKILPSNKETVKHNAQGQPTEIIWLEWDNAAGQWLNSERYELSYNENGNLIRETVSIWDPAGNQWLERDQYDMTYDASGTLLTELGTLWDEDSMKLVLTYKFEYVYQDGNLTTWNGYYMEEGEWVLYFRTTYTYDPNGNLIQELFEVSDPDMEMWVEYYMYLYTYNEKDQLILEEFWEINLTYFTLIQKWQYEYTWDSDGNLIEQVDRSWDAGVVKGTNAWLNAFKSEWAFNKDYTVLDLYVPYWFVQDLDNINFVHMPVSELGYVYVDEDWAYDYRQTAYWSEFGASTGVEEMQESAVNIFPIPAANEITISWDDSHASLYLELYDLTGKRVVSRSVENNESIGVNQLPGGIYLYKLTSNDHLIHSGKISIR